MWSVIGVFVAIVVLVGGGATGMFFFLRKNPQYLNVDKLLKEMKKEKLAELKTKVDEMLT